MTGSSKRRNFFGRMRTPGGTLRGGPSYTQCVGLVCPLVGWLAISASWRRNDMKAALGGESLVKEHLKPVYARFREFTIPHPQRNRNERQRSGKVDVPNRYVNDFVVGRLISDHDMSGDHALMAGHLEKDAQFGMDVGEGASKNLRANTMQVEETFAAGTFLDLVANDQ